MSQTLEQRVEGLEQKLADLTAQFLEVSPRKKDWRRTFGLMSAPTVLKLAPEVQRASVPARAISTRTAVSDTGSTVTSTGRNSFSTSMFVRA